MKKVFLLILLLMPIVGFLGCSNDKDKDNDKEGINYARFSNDEIRISAETTMLTLRVEWSLTTWEILSESDHFVTNFSVTTGGDETKSNAYTNVRVNLTVNLTTQERSRVIDIYDRKSGETNRTTIIQEARIPTTISLNPMVTYQTVTGFGGMLNPTWTTSQLTEAEIEKLYGENGLGYNIIRMMLYPNQGNWGRDTPIAKKAQDLGALVFASPWTPPAYMKTNNATDNEDGGSLKPEMYGEFAAHLKAFADYQKAQGVNLYAVSIQNEPDWKVSYDGCSWTPAELLRFVKEYGRQVGDGVKLIAGETVQFNQSYTDPILNDPAAVGNFDIVGTHLYGGGIMDYPLARSKNKEIWMTEHLFNEGESSSNSSAWDWHWSPSLEKVAKEIHDCMEANFNAYVWWYLKRFYSMLGENDSDGRSLVANGEISKRGYIMGHYAQYATGRTRIESKVQAGSGVLSTAYLGEKEMTVVLINTKTSPVLIQIDSPSDIGAASAVETTGSKNMESIDTEINADKRSVVLTLGSESIVSVKLQLP